MTSLVSEPLSKERKHHITGALNSNHMPKIFFTFILLLYKKTDIEVTTDL